MLDTAILSMQGESAFVRAYDEGVAKTEFWNSMLEDCLNLLARMPTIAAAVYRQRFGKGPRIAPRQDLDFSENFAHMLGLRDVHAEAADALRLYLVLHCDHEGGNVSAHTCSLVGSALSDAYYSVSAGLNGLSGPLHGLANQECLKWVLAVREQFGGAPTEDQLRKFAWETLESGRVIPGYGHAVLRVTDPRFTALVEFGEKHFPDDEIAQIVSRTYKVVPEVLREQGKAKNPWPNVDAASGAILYHYGMTEFPYYTVLFSVSRVMGMCAQLVWNRAMLMPIERPKSVPVAWLKDFVSKA
jgi:citrate synthase